MKMMEEGEERAMDCDKGGKVLRTVQERNIEVKGRDGGKEHLNQSTAMRHKWGG